MRSGLHHPSLGITLASSEHKSKIVQTSDSDSTDCAVHGLKLRVGDVHAATSTLTGTSFITRYHYGCSGCGIFASLNSWRYLSTVYSFTLGKTTATVTALRLTAALNHALTLQAGDKRSKHTA